MSSSSETASETAARPESAGPPAAQPALSRFALWPLPELAGGVLPGADPALAAAAADRDREAVAYARGHQAGRAEGLEEASRTLKRAAGLLVSTAEALEAARLGVVRELEDSVYLLALAVAQHLIQREVASDPGVVRDLVQRGLEAFPVGSRVEIHLHPEDLAVLRSQFELPNADGRASEIQWIPDAAVERGGCTLETPHRVVDGRVDTALRDLYQRLRDD